MRLIDADALMKDVRENSESYFADDFAEFWVNRQPVIHPVIVPCDYVKACNEVAMNKVTSAVAYFDALEELRKHGYVLVDMREVTE